MKKLTVATAAALALGVVVAPLADATTDPVYDPGATVPSKFSLRPEKPGADAYIAGYFVEYSVTLGLGKSYVKDLADDGLDVSVQVRYGKDTREPGYLERIATASGPNVSQPIEWHSPAGMRVEFIMSRLCFGPGEDNCGKWG
ncbi:hypothetical protein UK23_22445 [Lentzea aerocolonigenes]|uniref:Uncharacterized protein n=1 Tax=Lentzea aerocolonigenes TaxID=68170 RepID=A0A0F0GZC1_LENAE|nr:hypothetical protein [Lentzea aerocolonigenes]KJK46783.1 hypothetical protein UK23_22445 [Lentzea aerocolonigenes]